MNEEQLKQKFAEMLLANPGEHLSIGLQLFPDDPGHAFETAKQWINDPIVKSHMRSLVNSNVKLGEPLYPSKEKIVNEVIALGRIEDANVRDRLSAFKLVAEILGYIEKPQPNVNVQNNNVYRVMEMPAQQPEEEWEQQSIEQQRQLISDARSTRH